MDWAYLSSGWWLSHPSEKYESQLGWLFPIYGNICKHKIHVANHQPVIPFVTGVITCYNLLRWTTIPWGSRLHQEHQHHQNGRRPRRHRDQGLPRHARHGWHDLQIAGTTTIGALRSGYVWKFWGNPRKKKKKHEKNYWNRHNMG